MAVTYHKHMYNTDRSVNDYTIYGNVCILYGMDKCVLTVSET